LTYELFWDVAGASFSGVAIAFFTYWLLSNQPYSLRLIDFVSFSFGFLALIAGLFASYRYREDLLRTIDQLLIKSNVVDIAFDTSVDTMRLCTRIPHTPYRPAPSRKAECDKLDQYVASLKFDPRIPTALPLLNIVAFNDPVVRDLAEKTLARVKDTNREISEYNIDLDLTSRAEFWEALFRDLALPVLGVAFGLGVGRRIIDLYVSLPPRLKAPFQRLVAKLLLGFNPARHAYRRFRRRAPLVLSATISPEANCKPPQD
jgi:hypothetical protein